MTHIDLFSGIGGFALAAQWAGFQTVAFVEIEPYAQEIIKQNFGAVADAASAGMSETSGPLRSNNGPVLPGNGERLWNVSDSSCPTLHSDIRQFDGVRYRGATLLTGGFPCQPFSQAGKRRGAADDRALWPEMFRVICEVRPTWVLGENVAGIVTMELDNCISDLEGEGYSVQPLIIPACAVDAIHRRDRVWIVAHCDTGLSESAEPKVCAGGDAVSYVGYGNRAGQQQRWGAESVQAAQFTAQCTGEDVDDTNTEGLQRGVLAGTNQREWPENEHSHARNETRIKPDGPSRWLPEPDVGRVAHGVSDRVDRLKGLGNAIVPQVAYEILKGIAVIEGKTQVR
jgi:DNA (cytosine-5)-methyltransferase 1